MPAEKHTLTPIATTVTPLLWGVADLAGALNVSVRKIQAMQSAGELPERVFAFGRRCLWNRAEIESWVQNSCPSREKWNTINGERR
jgi:predicted DNA-binding transcriptional regulator AlpA